ncbi:lipopolysaccharide biosynthesis protein [Flexibacterium corallicola]|uniref:lipopolysaccharide biosynthesis protein n=1 Tax=Flexibacterium corallicola TaxID=3037259 RepID=UPI00286F4CD8|nr:lipopolysaccharide biosynthesis protein [Pseudovibrio sp. M1P-2-3]
MDKQSAQKKVDPVAAQPRAAAQAAKPVPAKNQGAQKPVPAKDQKNAQPQKAPPAQGAKKPEEQAKNSVVPAKKLSPAQKAVASIVPLPVKARELQEVPQTLWDHLRGKGLRPQQFRRRMLAVSFALCVALPAVLGSFYFLFLASDRYSSTLGFSVRGMDGGAAGGDFLGSLTGLASTGSTTTDSYILMDYLKSREVVERLSADMGLKQLYSSEDVDFIYRLDPELPIEDFVNYWDWMIDTSFDSTSSIINVEVQAFTAQDTKRLADLVLSYSAQLVNNLSESARKDAVKYAEEEVSRAELRLRMIRARLREFRSTENSLDPTKNAEVQIQLVAELEKQLIDTRSRLSRLVGTIDESSPTVRQLRKQESALLEQIGLKQSEIGGVQGQGRSSATGENSEGKFSSLSSLLADYEELVIEREFAEQAYTASLASLERSRSEADRQQRYLAVFQQPSEPENALYPRRFTNSLLLLGVLLALWSLGTLLTYSVRDHLR